MSESSFFQLPTNKLYKKENTKRLKNFPAGYVGNFYRSLADNVDTSSDFFAQISNDANIPRDDVQKYLLATSDFANSIQMGINHYVTRDRINTASLRRKLDPISKNILRRQNLLELVFEDLSTFDAENPIVGSLLREIEIKNKNSDSDFIKYLPSHPGKEFEIRNRLDKPRDIRNDNFNYNNDSRPPSPAGRTNIDFLNKYGLDRPPPSLPTIEDFIIDNGPPPPPPASGTNISFNNNTPFVPPQQNFDIVNNPFVLPNIGNNGKIGNDMFESVAAMAGPREQEKTKKEIDDFLYELPDDGMPHLELRDKLAGILGTEGEDLFDANVPLSKKEEEDEILQNVIEEYDIPGMKDTMDETGQVPESIYFFYGGDSQNFVDALEFIDLSPINREFAAFLLSDLGRQTMT